MKPGDTIYYKEGRKMAYCRIVAVERFDFRRDCTPGYTEYKLDIVEQWYNHEYLEPIPIFLFGRGLKVGRANPPTEYSGQWEFYDQQEIDKYYGLQSNPKKRRQVEFVVGCRRVAIGCAVLLPLLLVFIVLFAR